MKISLSEASALRTTVESLDIELGSLENRIQFMASQLENYSSEKNHYEKLFHEKDLLTSSIADLRIGLKEFAGMIYSIMLKCTL